MTLILDGKVVRDNIMDSLRTFVASLAEEKIPALSIIQIGANPASSSYIRGKIAFGKSIGVPIIFTQFQSSVSEEKVIELIMKQNGDPSVGGIIVQLPLPPHVNKDSLIEAIHPLKDVDGLHSVNIKKLWENNPSGMVPATTRGIFSLLGFYQVPLEGKRVLVIGRSTLVGKPTAIAFLNHNATVTVAHSKSKDLEKLCKEADIIISATGMARLIGKMHVKKEHIIVDVGIVSDSEGNLAGDVYYDEVFPLVCAVSPVPGGVGPLTVASLFQNLLKGVK